MTLRRKYYLFLSLGVLLISHQRFVRSEDKADGSGGEYSEYNEYGHGTGEEDDDDTSEDMSGDDIDQDFDENDEDGKEESEDAIDDGYTAEDYDAGGRPCTAEIKKIRSSSGVDAKKAEETFIPQCTTTGEFTPRQCHEELCWCVTREGEEQKNSRHSSEEYMQCAGFNPDHPKKSASVSSPSKNASFSTSHPAFLAAIVVMVIMGLAGAVLVAMFIVYRMRKKDEGSYALAHNNSTAPERRSTRSLIFGATGVAGTGGKDGAHPQDQHFYSLQQQLQQPLQQEFYA